MPTNHSKSILLVLLLQVCAEAQMSKQHTPTIEQLFNVKTIKVKKMTTRTNQVNYGYIVPDDARVHDVHAWYSGYVTQILADTRYKKVHKGEALATVYSPEVYQAKQDYLHSLEFNEKNTSPKMLESAQTKLRLLGVSQAEIMSIKKERKITENTLIHAPISGWIYQKSLNNGTAFTSQKKLFQIIDLEKVWVEVKLYQNEIEKLALLDHFSVNVKGIPKTYTAEKSLVYPALNPLEATATLRLLVDNNDTQLKTGMYVKVTASTPQRSSLVIPHSAAIRKNGQWYAFLATDFKGEYEPVPIEVKPLNTSHYEVLNGLNEGESIVNNALFMMDSDAQINGIY